MLSLVTTWWLSGSMGAATHVHRANAAVRVTHPRRGGHVAAYEEPELHAQELRDLFRPLRA